MRLLMVAAGFVCVLTGTAWGDADFGDLQDPTFPTLAASGSTPPGRTGPYHLDVSKEWIGAASVSTTTLEPEAKVVDLDEDDGFINVFVVSVDGLPANLGRVTVPVTTADGGAVRYLNVALDINGDGVFRTYPSVGGRMQWEWAVVNLPIVYAGETKVVTGDFTLLMPVPMVLHARATLTTEPIAPILFGANGWDGSGPLGGFSRGETEDHFNVPCLGYDYPVSLSGAHVMPNTPPDIPFPPDSPPSPGPPVSHHPKEPAKEFGPVRVPEDPGNGLTPTSPEADEPPRVAEEEPEANPVTEKGSVAGMPDIKQGPMECVPTATANSLRYLYDKGGNPPPADSDGFNRDLKNKLGAAMGTTPSHGTDISATDPAANRFLQGKKDADLPAPLRNAKVTTARANPSVENICGAIDRGEDVEIVITAYNPDGTKTQTSHMVTVVGYVKHADGTVELKIHDPNDRQPGENPGDTAKPPRENSIFIKPSGAAGDPTKGGLRVTGGMQGPAGKTLVIDHLFTEKLAQGGAPVSAGAPTTRVTEGGRVPLTASAGNKAGNFVYQWMLNDMDIPGATAPVYEIENASAADEGTYTCWAYDLDTEVYGVSNPVAIEVFAEGELPAGGLAALLAATLLLGALGARSAARGRGAPR